MEKVKSVACGYFHCLFLTNDGSVYSSGNNQYYQLCRKGRSTPLDKQGLVEEKYSDINCAGNLSIDTAIGNQGNIQGELEI